MCCCRQALPSYPLDTKAVVLLEDVTYTVALPTACAVGTSASVVKHPPAAGRRESVVRVEFDKDTKILSMNVWSIGPDGHEYAMKDKEMSDEGYGGGILFEDNKYRVAHAPAADPGAVIAYEYEQRIRPYVTEETWPFQDEIPHLHESFTLQLPAGYTYGTTWAHHPAAQPADTENHGWRWEMKDIPAIDLERVPMPPSDSSLAGRMTVHYAGPGIAFATDGTWKSIGEWYGNLTKDRLVATPEIAAKAAELTASKARLLRQDQEAIAEFVQKDIRYFAIEVGIGGYQPHAAADVFRNRYGDCKDKATLLSAMLSTVGIHAALVMVDTERGVVDPDAPSLVGDHMITGIEIPAGYTSPRLHSVVTGKTGRRYLIFDPTWDKTAFGQLEHNLQGGYGILMEGADSQAIAFPPLDPALNTIRRTAVMHLDSDGVLKGTVTDKHASAICPNTAAKCTPPAMRKSSASISTTSSNTTSPASAHPTSRLRTSAHSTRTSPSPTRSLPTATPVPWGRS